MNFLNYIASFLITFLVLGCANTRIVVEGVKTVLDKQEKNQKSTKTLNKTHTNGHYKIGKPYEVNNISYIPKLVSFYSENGIASWYGPKFDKKPTANGEIFDQNKVSAAHKTLPLPSIVKVTNLNSGKHLYIRVNDRGPFVNNRIIDLSKQAAIELEVFSKGIELVNVKLIESGPHLLENNFLDQKYLEEYAKNVENKDEKNKNKITPYNFLQLGVFSFKDNAIKYKEKILNSYKNSDFEFEIIEYVKETKVFFKLLIGPMKNKQLAQNVADNLLKLGYSSIIISNRKN